MKHLLLLFLGILFLALQTTVFQALPLWMGVPDLLTLFILFLALHDKPLPGALLTLFLAVGLETFSGYFLGLYAIAYLMVFALVQWLAGTFALREMSQQPGLAAISLLLVNGFVYLASMMLEHVSSAPWQWGAVLQRLLIITILAMPVNRWLLSLTAWCDHKKRHRTFFQPKKGNRYRARV